MTCLISLNRALVLKILRTLSIFIGICGFILYGLILFTWQSEWRQSSFSTRPLLEQAWFVLDDAIFLSGLPPLIVSTYFLILKKNARANGIGIIFVVLFILIHYYVAATTAHSTPDIYIPAQVAELIATVSLILMWRSKVEKGKQ